MNKQITKYTFSSIIKPIGHEYNYKKYNGTSLNRPNKAQKEAAQRSRAADDIQRVKQAVQETYTIDYDTGEIIAIQSQATNNVVQYVGCDGRESIQEQPCGDVFRSDTNISTNQLSTERYRTMSSRTRSKIKQKIKAWYYASKRYNQKFTFVTLTFIEHCDDSTAIKCLNNFLTWVRKNKTNFQYLWVAERQQSGRIHYHIICNKFLPVDYYNAYWVACQRKAGLVNSADNLHPLDIRSVKQIRTLSKYITKYVTKNDSEFTCQVWNCSRSVSAFATGFTSDDTLSNYIADNRLNYSHSSGRDIFPEKVNKEYAIIEPLWNSSIPDKYYRVLHEFNFLVISAKSINELDEIRNIANQLVWKYNTPF